MKVKIDMNPKLAKDELEVTIHTNDFNENQNKVLKLIQYIELFDKQKEIISIKTADSIEIINQQDIIYMEILNKDMTIITNQNEYQTKGRLYQMVENLNEKDFVQVSKSTIINANKLLKLENYFSGSMIAFLKGGYKVPVTRVYLPRLKEHFNI